MVNGSRTLTPPSLFWGPVRLETEAKSLRRNLTNVFEPGATESVLVLGDTHRALGHMPDGAFQCCVTSPPYWSLRNYHIEGQIGLEQTLDEYLRNLTDVFSQVYRVVK